MVLYIEGALRQPNILSLASLKPLKPKKINSFHTSTTVNELEIPQKMQIGVKMPSKESKNNFGLYLMAKIMAIISVLFGPKNIALRNIFIQKYRTYLPACSYAECPPGILRNIS